jgi:hypothetical protein
MSACGVFVEDADLARAHACFDLGEAVTEHLVRYRVDILERNRRDVERM